MKTKAKRATKKTVPAPAAPSTAPSQPASPQAEEGIPSPVPVQSATPATTPSSSSSQNPTPPPPVMPWWQFIKESSDAEIRKRFQKELLKICDDHKALLASYSSLAILSPSDSIDSFEADRIFTALVDGNPKKEKDVLLMILSPGGSIEPAYQVSTLCKSYAKQKFITVVPRRAKSAATLIAIGADQIHMGPLSQLGPIDPQLGGLPALGVVEAIRRIAQLAQENPGSSEMFSMYLKLALTVEQIGYCERIGKSAVQYATRLLGTKPSLKGKEAKIATELVYEYMDHGFVIDFVEAQKHLGTSWIVTDTEELVLAEKLYRLFEDVNLYLGVYHKKHLAIIGSLFSEPIIWQNR